MEGESGICGAGGTELDGKSERREVEVGLGVVRGVVE